MTMKTFLSETVTLYSGDCLAVLPQLDDRSCDSVVCDPPYGLEFMGKEWDGADGFRRSLNLADCARDSVFGRTSRKSPEYRTSGAGRKGKPGIGAREIEWVSNSGWNQFRCDSCGHMFHGGSPCQCESPKPVRADNRWNLFQEWCEAWARECLRVLKPGGHILAFSGTRTYHRMACAIEDAGFEIRDQIGWAYGSGFPKSRNLDGDWDGWGTALKPAWEPICVARKPLLGTVATNMQRFGVGALNIAACRVGCDERVNVPASPTSASRKSRVEAGYRSDNGSGPGSAGGRVIGRWPANICHDGSDEVMEAFPDAPGQQRSVGPEDGAKNAVHCYGDFGPRDELRPRGDGGSAARFFYAAKADAEDRLGSKHPTVKPIDLIQWLVRLVTPRGGVVLDCFAGTGTTGEAAWREGMRAILIEREPEYLADIARRMELAANPTKRAAVAKTKNNLDDPNALPLFSGIDQ